MAGKARYRVYELIEGGLPVFVGACRVDELPPRRDGESVCWLLGCACALDEPAARRLARERVKQIARWADPDGGPYPEHPPWLRNRRPRPPAQRGRTHGR